MLNGRLLFKEDIILYILHIAGLQESMIMSSSQTGHVGHPNTMKYQENHGSDTFSDFVTLVCQEAQNSQTQVSNLSSSSMQCFC